MQIAFGKPDAKVPGYGQTRNSVGRGIIMGIDISRGRWKNLAVTVKPMHCSLPGRAGYPWLVGVW